jgi:CBS domain containing-hemolysin-like protein
VTIVLVVALLLLANALFVAAEFAVVGAPRTAVETRARQGDRLSRRLLEILSSPVKQDRYIATAQLGITLASLGLGMYGEHTLATWLEPRLEALRLGGAVAAHTVSSVIAIATLTYLHIFLGEMIPKAIALSHAEATARVVFVPMRLVLFAFYPFVVGLNAIGNFCLRLIGIRRQENPAERAYTAEELQIIVEESEEGGALRAESSRLLRELFEFGDLTAGEAMVPRVRVAGIPAGAPPDQLRRLLATYRRTRYPVYDGDLDHIVGMMHVKDALRLLLQNVPLGAADARPIPAVPTTAPLDHVLETMQKAQAHLAVVIDEHGGTAGILSLEDLFEEVVGEIDEGVPVTPSLAANPDGSVTAAGTLRLDELGAHFHLDLEHEDVDSVSGLVLARLGRPPEVGDAVDYGRLHVEVTAVSGRGVQAVRATLREE